MKTQDLSTDIDKYTTLPDMASVQTEPSRSIKLPGPKSPSVYIPVNIHIEKPSGVALVIGIFLTLSACTLVNVGMLFLHQIIIVK
jgi:hypothetical protein